MSKWHPKFKGAYFEIWQDFCIQFFKMNLYFDQQHAQTLILSIQPKMVDQVKRKFYEFYFPKKPDSGRIK
jgi:hypothetical protein